MSSKYEKKYLKYKQKYTELKNQLGGHNSLSNKVLEIREEIKNGKSRNFVLDLVDELLSDTYNDSKIPRELELEDLNEDDMKYKLSSKLPKEELDKISDTELQNVHFSTINVLNKDGSKQEIPVENPFLSNNY